MKRLWENYERLLGIDREGPTGSIIRARAIYAFSWAFFFVQLANQFSMYITYGGYTKYHIISVIMALTLLFGAHLMLHTQKFLLFTCFALVVHLGGILGTAGPSGSGINTTLVPFIVVAPILSGFISGWRMTLIAGAFSVLLIWFLYHVSIAAPVPGFEVDPARNFERACQATYSVLMATVMGCAFGASIFHAFEKLERTAQRARKAEAAKARFLANMSHELRTPLNGVLGLTQSLRTSTLNSDQLHLVQTIEKSGDALLTILNDILDLSKIDAGRLEITEHPFSIHKLVQDICDGWCETAKAKSVELTFNIDPTVSKKLLGDDIRVRQIINNLVSNALKFTDQGTVEISVSPINYEGKDFFSVKVKDTGPGIAPKSLSKIFQPFEQGDPDTTRKFGGTGLGLAICRNLAQLMGGDIFASSTLGAGSTFELRLPHRAVEGDLNNPANEQNASLPNLDTVRVLIVEDNTINQMVVQRFLQTLGASYATAENGKEAVELLLADPSAFDVVLMDKHMPVMDGIEATKTIRMQPDPIGSLPVIACTADAMTGEREGLLANGFNDFLSKPIRLESLAAALNAAVTKDDCETIAA
ncbi:MAG: ATP-binding protein [Pseudomonadota bacterium]